MVYVIFYGWFLSQWDPITRTRSKRVFPAYNAAMRLYNKLSVLHIILKNKTSPLCDFGVLILAFSRSIFGSTYIVSEFLSFVLSRMLRRLVILNKAKFSPQRILITFGKILAMGCTLDKAKFTSWTTFVKLTCMPAYFCHYYFLWSTWHVIFSHTKFQIGINISQVKFLLVCLN